MASVLSFTSVDELKQIFIDKGSEVIAFIKDKQEIEIDGCPGKTQQIQWRCSNDSRHISTNKISDMLKRELFLCLSCGRRGFSSGDKMREHFKEKGSDVLAIIEDDIELPVTFAPSGNTKIKWVCAENNSHVQISSLNSVTGTGGNRDRYVCRGCGISKSRGGPTYDSFVTQLEQAGWTMMSGKEVYDNNKSMMDVTCDNGHTTQTSQNKFASGHRCARCHFDAKITHTIEDIAIEFEEHGFQLTDPEYINNHTPLAYICKCGRIGRISYSNFTKNIDGCKECTRRWTIQQVADFFDEVWCVLLVVGTQEFVLNETKVTYICSCGETHTSTWRLFKNGARCMQCTIEKTRQTCIKKFGEDNPAKVQEIKDKIVATMRERYDKNYAMQVKKFVDKNIATNKANHGGQHNLTLAHIRQASVDTFEQKYNGKFGTIPEHQEKARQAIRALTGEESGYIIGGKWFGDRMEQLHGARHSQQIPKCRAKAMKTAMSTKHYIMPSGNIVDVQGYEPYALEDILINHIDDLNVKEDDVITGCIEVPTIAYRIPGYDEPHVYYPDIYIKSLNLLIEIKSTWTFSKTPEMNRAKFLTTSMSGYDFEVWIYDDKGNRVEVHCYDCD